MKKLLVGLMLTVLSIACSSSEGPEVKRARKLAAKLDDQREAADIVNAAVAWPVNCAEAAKNAFDPNTDKARFWFYRRDDGHIECYDSAGYHRTKRTPLRKFTTMEVQEILGNPSCYPPPTPCPPPPSAPTVPRPPVVTPAPTPTPLPQLGEGPCCERQ